MEKTKQQTSLSKMNRDDILRKIQALQQRTVENGCTEDESIQASKMLDKLLLKHNLTLSDAHVKESHCDMEVLNTGTKRMPAWLKHLANTCARHFDCQMVYNGGELKFLGLKEDVSASTSLYQIIVCATNCEITRYKSTTGYFLMSKVYSSRCLCNSFRYGMIDRLRERLREIKDERNSHIEEQRGTSLVLVKNELIQNHLKEAFPNLRTVRSNTVQVSSEAYRDGKRAANNFSLRDEIQTHA